MQLARRAFSSGDTGVRKFLRPNTSCPPAQPARLERAGEEGQETGSRRAQDRRGGEAC